MQLEIQDANTNWVDITPYIAFEGLKYSMQAVDGPAAGRTQSGDMVRDVVAYKIRWDVTCKPLNSSELSTILTLIKPESFNLRFLNPETNTTKTGSFYSNNVPAQFKLHRANGEEIWAGVAFPLIEI